ncbi:MAG: hypothetical protein ACI910_001259 [Oleispira sp.]|jgi:hypothetical protein
MAPISFAGSTTIPAAQPPRSQAERSAPAAKVEDTAQQEKQIQRANDEQGRRSSEQVKATDENSASPSVTQADDKKSAGEQQKIEAAQQEAQRAEFDQQAGNVRKTEPNDVRPPSNFKAETVDSAPVVKVEPLQAENAAIEIFVQLQNIDNPSRQGQEVNRFA